MGFQETRMRDSLFTSHGEGVLRIVVGNALSNENLPGEMAAS
jgi:hypothetical protein